MNKIIRKKASVLGFIIMCCVSFLSCGEGGADHDALSSASDNDEIVIWTWDSTFNVKAARLAAEKYSRLHPEITVRVEEMEREEILYETKNMLSSGLYDRLPDIVMIEDYDAQDVLLTFSDEFVDLTDKVDSDKYVDYKKELCTINGRMYGIPFDSGTAAFFYRTDLLEEAGYSFPALIDMTWEDFEKMSRDVYLRTGRSMITMDPTDMSITRVIMQSCGRWYVKEDGYTPDIAGNEAISGALDVYHDLIATNGAKSVNGWNDFISAFQNGDVAGVITGCWIISNIKAVPEQSGKWRIAKIPVFDDIEGCVPASSVGGSSWYVLKNSHNSEAAAEFAISMLSEDDELTDKFIEEIGLIPAVKDPSVYKNYDTVDPFFGGQKATRFLSELAGEIPVVNYGRRTYEIENILEAEFQSDFGKSDHTECLRRVEEKAKAVSR